MPKAVAEERAPSHLQGETWLFFRACGRASFGNRQSFEDLSAADSWAALGRERARTWDLQRRIVMLGRERRQAPSRDGGEPSSVAPWPQVAW
jgi:hypothetical protein